MLPVFMTVANRPVILLGSGPIADAKARLLLRAGAQLVHDETADARLAIVAIEDRAEAEAAVARLRARAVLVNAVDRADLSDFILPAIIDRAPVLIAIGTSGASAGLSKMLRQALERLLPQKLGALASALRNARPDIVRRFPEAQKRRAFIDQCLMPDGPLDPLVDHPDPADTLNTLLAGKSTLSDQAKDIIRLSSPDPDELTLRAARLLSMADLIIHSPDVPATILDRARADATRLPSDQAPAQLPDGRIVFLEMDAR